MAILCRFGRPSCMCCCRFSSSARACRSVEKWRRASWARCSVSGSRVGCISMRKTPVCWWPLTAAAGLAGVYNAPLAGTFFAVEILLADITLETVTLAFACSALASWVASLVKGTPRVLPDRQSGRPVHPRLHGVRTGCRHDSRRCPAHCSVAARSGLRSPNRRARAFCGCCRSPAC